MNETSRIDAINGPAHEDEHLHHGLRFAEETQGFFRREVQNYARERP